MRNWMLTPLIVVGLAGAHLDLRNPRAATAASAAERELTVLAGAGLSLRQLGPLRPGDQDLAVAVRHHHGPRPERLRAWIGDALPVELALDDAVTTLAVPVPTAWDGSRLWLEAVRGRDRGRAVFAVVG